MNVLSLFDGMSCGQIALNRLGIKYDNYYAAEVDKHAIKVTQTNYPNTIQLGDVTKIKASDLPQIDLLIGGSPCQGFSFAGKQLNFDDPRSKLFFEFVRLLKELKPKYFLLENVRMKKEYQDIITQHLEVEPLEINSDLVSAQNRRRLYWTNIPIEELPEDKGILVKHILLDQVDDKYYLKENHRAWFEKNKEFQLKKKYSSLDSDKAITMLTRQYDSWNGNFITSTNRIRKLTPVECERLQTVPDNYTSSESDRQRYKMLGNGWTVDVIKHIFQGIRMNDTIVTVETKRN